MTRTKTPSTDLGYFVLPERKPCPFCGEAEQDKLKITGIGAYYIFCVACNAEGPWSKSEASAVVAWNYRPEEPMEGST